MNNRLLVGSVIVVLVSSIAVGAFLYYQKVSEDVNINIAGAPSETSEEVRGSDIFIEQHNMEYLQAIQRADASILSRLPKADTLKAETIDEVSRLFDLSRLAASFGATRENVAYLLKILDSDSVNAESFKSVAAFFLINDAVDDPRILIPAVTTSPFLQQFRSVAETVFFPRELAASAEGITSGQKTRFAASYLVALSEREDAFAASANASLIIGSYYMYISRTPGTDAETLAKFKALSHMLLGRAVTGAKKVLSPSVSGISAYDTVAGLDNLSIIMDGITLYHLGNEFPEAAGLDATEMLKTAHSIAKSEAVGLDTYTTYLYAAHLARFSENTSENNDTIETLVRRLTGVPPFNTLSRNSWAMRRLIGSKSTDFSNAYRRENIAAVARRSPTLHAFLVAKDGWTDKDFALEETFK